MFGQGKTFLEATLAGAHQYPLSSPVSLPSGEMRQLAEGIVEFHCQSASNSSLILSAGIHGDETASIEIIDKIVTDILHGTVTPLKNCLFILGNPPAMIKSVRFIDENMNLLFRPGTHTQSDQAMASASNYEMERAGLIMKTVTEFTDCAKPILHYDLHTAIRPSKLEKFGVFPYLPARSCPEYQLAFLGRCSIYALLLQNNAASTFSAWTATEFGAESFTLELSKVNRFGQSDSGKISDLDYAIRDLISSAAALPSRHPQPQFYPQQFSVIHEIINSGDDFELNITEDTPSFTEYQSGYLIWQDATQSYQVSDGPVAVVFPNAKVGKGKQAGLIVKRGPTLLV